MTLSFLQQRLVRVLTRPPELLYALTRHWFLLIFCVLLGTAITWVIVVSQPMLYEGRAQLLVNPNDPILQNLALGQRTLSGQELSVFLAAQSAILQSDVVLRKLVSETQGESTPVTISDLEDGNGIVTRIRRLKRDVSEFLLLQEPVIAGTDEQKDTQRAIEGFRKRSAVYPDSQGNTIDLLVYGKDRAAVKRELKLWIDAYKARLAEMTEPTWTFLSSRGVVFETAKDAARAELNKFTQQNPGVSEAREELLSQQIVQYSVEASTVRSRMELGEELGPALDERHQDPKYGALVNRKADLELEREEAIEDGFHEDSPKVLRITKRISSVEEKLAAFDGVVKGESPDDRTKALENRAKLLEGQLRLLRDEKVLVTSKLKQYKELESRYEKAKERLDDFNVRKGGDLDSAVSKKTLTVQTSDEPAVNTEPYKYRPLLKLGMGCVAGLVAGMVFAVLLEVLCGKVRLKHDLIDDFGLPVITVLPK